MRNGKLFPADEAVPCNRSNEGEQAENIWQALWENYPHPIFIVDAEGVELHRNASAKRLLHDLIPMQLSGLTTLLRNATTQRAYVEEQWTEFKVTVSGTGSSGNSSGTGVWMIQLTKKTAIPTSSNNLCRSFRLTQREAEVCALVIQGYSDKEISKTLTIGFPTVRTHLSRAFAKIGVTSRSELIHRVTREQ